MIRTLDAAGCDSVHDVAGVDALTICALGIDARTGRSSIPALKPDALAEVARASAAERLGGARGLLPDVDPDDLGSAGWGIVLARDAPTAVRDALAPLIAWRRDQATHRDARRFRLFADEDGYQLGERTHGFLARHGAGFGPVDPTRVPYYLLLVGGPESIPYEVEHQLGVQYAVGRLSFDLAADYASYAESVIDAEAAPVAPRPREVAFFGVRNGEDLATEILGRCLLGPLIERLRRQQDWSVTAWMGAEATKPRLLSVLAHDPPALLITGCHGLELAAGDPEQRALHGALVCAEWPGPAVWPEGPIPESHYLAAHDIGANANLHGTVCWHIACFSAGVPRFERFAHRRADDPSRPVRPRLQAPKPFVSALPRRLLAHPRGGALAVVGHVDRAWEHSWVWSRQVQQIGTFRAALDDLLRGARIGHALRTFGERYAELAAALAGLVEEAQYGVPQSALELARLWTATQDARGWVLLGDPAVRLATDGARADRSR